MQPQIWRCGNPNCSNIISDVNQKTIPKKYCSDECRQAINRSKHNYYQRKLKVKQWKHNHYLRHREEILRKAKEKYHLTKGEKRPYVKTPESVKAKLIYYLTHREERLAYQRDYYQRKKTEVKPIA